jgi:pyridoxal 5'-phosphate synthase pdxS subunit
MAKCRIGHEAEARALESLGVDMIDESEVLTPADPFFHVNKRAFEVPFVCGARNLGEAVRRTWEGAAMIRTKGEAGTGDVVEAVRHIRLVTTAIAELKRLDSERLQAVAVRYADSYTKLLKEVRAAQGPEATVREDDVVFAGAVLDDITEGIFQLLTEIKKIQRLPVVNFAAGGVATPADAALMMLMGVDGVFVGSGIFKAENPETRGRAIIDAVAHFDDPTTVAEVSKGIGLAMKGLDAKARLVRHDLDRDLGEEGADLLEEAPLRVQRIAAAFRGIEEEQDAARDVGQGGDRLPLHRVPVRHRSVEEARRVEDLDPAAAPLRVPEGHALRREGVVGDLGAA